MLTPNTSRRCTHCLLLVLVSGCGRPASEIQNRAAEPARPADAAVVDCTGILHPARTYAVRVKHGETVQELLVKAGEEVAQGTPLARIASPDLQTELISAREKALALRRDASQLQEIIQKKEAADSRLAELKKRLDLGARLQSQVAGYDPGVHARPLLDEITRTETEARQLEQELLRGQSLERQSAPLLKSLEDRAAEIEKQLIELNVRAPFPGTVARLDLVPDPTDGTVLELQDRSSFNVHGALWQNQLRFVRLGSETAVFPDFLPDRCWTGLVSSIAFAPQAGVAGAFPRFPIIVSLHEVPEAPLLRDGMTVYVRIRPLPASQPPTANR